MTRCLVFGATGYPFHGMVFGGMVRNITGAAEQCTGSTSGPAVCGVPEGEQ